MNTKLKEIFRKSGYSESTIYSFINGHRPLFSNRQIKVLRLAKKNKVTLDELISNNTPKKKELQDV